MGSEETIRFSDADRPAPPVETAPEDVRSAAANPAQRCGKFVLIESVGVGGFGEVWKAWETGLDRYVALKFLTHVDSPEDRERFLREAHVAAKLAHPNIVAIYELGAFEGRDFLSMHFVEGRPLAQVRLDPRRALQVARDASRAVHYAHQQGIIHRDLKPGNLMLEDKTGHVWVLDFGLAKGVSAGTTVTVSGNIMGTPAYMAPEQARGETLDARADIYGLGATLYELATGHPPFRGENVVEILRRVDGEEPAPPRSLNPRLDLDVETIILKAMEKDAARRYATAGALADDIDRCLGNEPVQARRPSLAYRVGKRIRKQPLLYAFGVMLAAALIGGTAFGVVQILLRQQALEKQARALEQLARQARRNNIVEGSMVLVLEGQAMLPDPTIALDLIQSKFTEAIGRLEDGLREFPDDQRMMYWLGRACDVTNRDAAAERWYSAALERDPRDARARLYRARLRTLRAFAMLFRPDSDRAEIQPLLKLAREDLAASADTPIPEMDKGLWDAYALLASGPDRVGELREKCLARIAQPGRRDEYHFLLGLAEFAGGRWETAENALSAALDSNPRHLWALFSRGNARFKRQDLTGAERDFTATLTLDPDFALAWVNRGGVRIGLNDLKGALADLTRAIELLPDCTQAYNNRGSVFLRLKDADGALRDFETLVRLRPDDARAHFARALGRQEKGDHAGAIDDLTTAVKLNPDYAEAYVNRALLWSKLGDFARAEEDAGEAIRRKPDYATAFRTRGYARARRRNYEDALEDFSKAHDLAPNDPWILYERGITRECLDDLPGAEADSTAAIGLDPRMTPAFISRASQRLKRGNVSGAIEDYTEAIELDPAPSEPYFQRGVLRTKSGDTGGAEEDFTCVIERSPRDGQAYLNRGVVRYYLGDLQGAADDYEQADALIPDSADVHLNRGILKAKTSDLKGAVADFENALRVAPADWPQRATTEQNLDEARRALSGGSSDF